MNIKDFANSIKNFKFDWFYYDFQKTRTHNYLLIQEICSAFVLIAIFYENIVNELCRQL